jgi:hypothetical protein
MLTLTEANVPVLRLLYARVEGVEPTQTALETVVLPLNYTLEVLAMFILPGTNGTGTPMVNCSRLLAQ